MKNIHLIPTNKPSRLHYFTANNPGYYLYPNNELVIPQNPNCKNQNIHITNDEEIKEGDWLLIVDDFETYIHEHKGDNLPTTYYKKIILTTDQDLIKDGVQKIDDEFLEWFVKNPSCEEVEVERGKMKLNDDGQEYGFPDMSLYKIIIPKVEPKQREMFLMNANTIIDTRKPKQETLEEAKIKHTKFCIENNIENPPFSFDKGAKWQQEKDKNKYSEEEVLDIVHKCGKYCYDSKKIGTDIGLMPNLLIGFFEQFKKK